MSPAACPSNFTLDRLATGALPAEAAAAARAHLEGCEGCAARMRLRTFDGLPAVDPERALRHIQARLAAEPAPPAARGVGRLRGWLRPLVAAPLAAAAAALVLLIARPGEHGPAGEPDPPPGGLRDKGADLALHVHRAKGEGSEELRSGAQVAPGDRLRFVVDLPSPSRIGIVGVQADGALYTAWPLGEAAHDTQRPAGAGQELPGVAVLDSAPGPETLYLVRCPPAAPLPSCTSRGAGRAPACPPGCRTAPFVLGKGG